MKRFLQEIRKLSNLTIGGDVPAENESDKVIKAWVEANPDFFSSLRGILRSIPDVTWPAKTAIGDVVLRLEGVLEVWSQEGGHAAPDIVIDKHSVTAEIEDIFQDILENNDGAIIPGYWRLTLTKVDNPAPGKDG